MRTSVCGVLVLSVVTAGACGGKRASEPPVATPAATLNKPKAALGSPIEITYRFEVTPDAKINADYIVMSHFVDSDGQLMWTDDHQPPSPTSTWKPGQKIEYTRTIFIPVYPYIGEATVRVGLYSRTSQERLPLKAEGTSQREYPVAKIQLLPQSENVFIIYKEGWHPAEVSADNPAIEWQWTRKSATISFRNPKRDAWLYIETVGRVDLFNPPQQVTIRAGNQAIASFAADSKEPALHRFPITAAQLGSADTVDLTIDVDRTFVPAEIPGGSKADKRELGIRVFHTFVEPRS